MKALVHRLATDFRKRLRLGHSLSELDPYLAGKQLAFRAPPLTPELVAAIKLISPQFHLRRDEPSRRFWELNQNGLSWGEYEALEPFLSRLEAPPSQVLDIGPGLGRSVIFFKKTAHWESVPFHLYEGSGSSTKYTKAGPRFDDSFCGNFEALEALLRFNDIEHYQIFDARETADLSQLPGPYDFIYSFFAVGFHWSIVHFLDDLMNLMHDRSIGAFTLHDRFVDFDALAGVPHKIVTFRRSWPRERWSKMLVLCKSASLLET